MDCPSSGGWAAVLSVPGSGGEVFRVFVRGETAIRICMRFLEDPSRVSAYDVDFNRLQRSQDRPFWLRDCSLQTYTILRPLWKRQVWTASCRGGWGGMIS